MLKKLFAHEWKDCWRLVGIMNLIVMAITIIGMLVFKADSWSTAGSNSITSMTMFLYILVYVISLGALGFATTLYFYFRFYKNLYTDQGYLMHTLPVNAHQLIWSKAFVAIIWNLISGIVIAFSMVAFMFSAVGAYEEQSFWDIMADIIKEINITGKGILIAVLIILVMAASMLMSVFMGYASVSIGQMFKKQKVLGAVGVYIGMYMVVQMCFSYATIPFSTMTPTTEAQTVNFFIGILALMIVVMGAVATGLYFIIYHIMRNKLNLE